MIPELRPYQLDLVQRLRAARGNGARIVVMQAATGAGKTSIAAHIAKQAVSKGSQVLFLVHRRKLVDQISSRLEEFQVNHGIVMRGEKPYSAAVQVASRDTILSRCFTHEWIGLPQAHLVIVDEAHRAAAEDSEYRRILANYPNATILLMTATPVGPDGKGLGPWAQAIECAASTSQLIKDGFLVPVKCIAPDRKVKRGKTIRGICGDLVESWKQYAEGLPTVLFCSRVQHSLDAVDSFKAAGIPFAHVDADTDDDERDRIFEQLEAGKLKGVANVGIIKEGVDIPCLGCCQFWMDPAGRVAFLQGVGRIMRPFPGKTHGVLIDHAGACFRHGFPDEDTEWTLEGNTDEAFKKKKDANETEKLLYCKACELMFHGTLACPQCGKMPSKPPKSIFAPPPVDASDELLVEADRKQKTDPFSIDEKIKHWKVCLGAAAARNGSLGQAAQIYKRKYNEFPRNDFPYMPERWEWQKKVIEKFPGFDRKRKAKT